MLGLVPGIHDLTFMTEKTWMTGPSQAMTIEESYSAATFMPPIAAAPACMALTILW